MDAFCTLREAKRFRKASMAWVRASIPVSAVIEDGRLIVRRGSRTAVSGIRQRSLTAYLYGFPSIQSVMTAAAVASEPVPAVVGTANSGGSFRRTFRRPRIAGTHLIKNEIEYEEVIKRAKEFAKEEVSKALLSFGVTKLEGMKVSSITASKETVKSVAKLEILNKEALLKAGYFKVELDLQEVEEALLSADKREEVQDYADIKIEKVVKGATIRINKRKNALASDELSFAA